MSFCTKCGRQLADGEVCTCQQPVQPQINPAVTSQINPKGAPQMNAAPKAAASNPTFISEIGALFKGLFTKPADAIAEYVKSSSIMTSAIVICVLAFLNGIASLLYMVGRNVDAKITAAKYYNPLIPSTWVVDEPYSALEIVFRFVSTVLSNIVISVLFAALIYLLIKFIFEKDSSIKMPQVLAVASIRNIIYIPLCVVANAIGIIPVSIFDTFGNWITSFGSAFSIVLLIMAIKAVMKDENRMPWVYAVTIILVTVVSTFLGAIESALAGLM